MIFSISDYICWVGNQNTLQIWLYFTTFIVDITILEYAFAIIEIANRFKVINTHLIYNCSLKDLYSDSFLDVSQCAEFIHNESIIEISYCKNDNCNLQILIISFEKLIENISILNKIYGFQVINYLYMLN